MVIVYVTLNKKEGYYQWMAGPVWGGPWNMPTRLSYAYNPWFYDIRGPPYPYPPATLPGPNPSENTTDERDSSADGQSAGPVGLQVQKEAVDEPINKANNRDAAIREYEKEARWLPGWARWSGWWGPMFNYGLMYDTDGQLKRANNDSIPSNHQWSWAWWW